jgi:hypothetical protein
MALDSVRVLLASDVVARLIFTEILRNRSAIFKDLLGAVGRAIGGGEESRRQVEAAVSQLKEADLIKERTTPIEDFNSYYVTADGLAAERELHLN